MVNQDNMIFLSTSAFFMLGVIGLVTSEPSSQQWESFGFMAGCGMMIFLIGLCILLGRTLKFPTQKEVQ